jgi:hypothetical protein
MHKFITVDDIQNISPTSDYDVVFASGAWGDRFLNIFFDYAQRNHKMVFDTVQKRYEYIFYTRQEDYEKYKDKFIMPNITFVFMDKEPRASMNNYHMHYAYQRKLPLVFISSDGLFCINVLNNILTKYAHHDALGIMFNRMFPQIIDAISEKEKEMPYEKIFEPRTFLKLCLPNLHQRERRYFVDSYRATGTYGSLFFPYRKDGVLSGILVRSFHIGIIYVKNPLPGYTDGYLDSSPFLNKLATPDTIGMITDSDDGFCIDLSFDRNDLLFPPPDELPVLADESQITRCWQGWRGNVVTACNESLMGFNTALHSEPLNKEWIDLAKKADDMVTRLYGGAIKNKHLDWRFYNGT